MDGESRPLPQPFFVIATQNPASQFGTYPLPESQLDRFLMCIELGYPNREYERKMLQGEDYRKLIDTLEVCIEPLQLQQIREQARQVKPSPMLLDYIQRLVACWIHLSR